MLGEMTHDRIGCLYRAGGLGIDVDVRRLGRGALAGQHLPAQAQAEGAPDAAGRAGDQRDLSFERAARRALELGLLQAPVLHVEQLELAHRAVAAHAESIPDHARRVHGDVAGNARVLIPDINIPTIVGTLTVQPGGALKQTRNVNNASVSFLQISTGKYRGVDLTTPNNLGSTTVVITTTSSNSCTTALGGSPAYAHRCYSITPTTNATATVQLWALTSELNGILESNLAPYRYNGSTWVKLTNISTGNDGGSYSFAQGDTTGFSPFLLGDDANAPTVITLIDFSERPTSSNIVLIASLIALTLLIIGLRLRRKVRA